ncbi:hypothetical protein WR25_12838 [Diploscapter pachys]|uniref:Uncharacterized protein n=1 Tax=Diploscapter pachys TaxID=2018661 RepID=A0A2A2JBA7_9BILA|nr:hypothetical protein WR25_12838 [Diploscapter pachys]
MLQMVPMPVAEIESTPGPKYSTIAPVPPFTNDILSGGPAGEVAGEFDSNDFRALQLPRNVRHHIHCVRTSHADAQATEAA